MNNININNYEAYLLDYVDGNLSAELRAELLLFIAQHPELEVDLEGISDIVLKPEQYHLDNKSQLHQIDDILLQQFQQLAVLVLDDEADVEEKKQFDQLLNQYTILQKHFEQLQKTVLSSEISTSFPFKDALLNIPDARTEFERLAVADLEGLNDALSKKQFEQLLLDSPLFQREMFIFQQTILRADKDVVYSDKGELKKVVLIPSLWSRNWKTAVAGIAATFLIAISLFNFFNENEQSTLAITIYETSSSTPKTNKKGYKDVNAAKVLESSKEVILISEEKQVSPSSVLAQTQSIPKVQIEKMSPIQMEQLPVENELLAGIDVDQINPIDMAIKFYPEDGILENEPTNNDILKLKNLALRQLNKAVGAPEEKEWTGNDIALSVEQAFNGAVKIQNEREDKRQTFGFSIGNFSYERSRGR